MSTDKQKMRSLALRCGAMVRLLTCVFKGHRWQKITHDTHRGVVCGLSYFTECTRCGEVRVTVGCQHYTCGATIHRHAERGGKVMPEPNKRTAAEKERDALKAKLQSLTEQVKS